jgi:hypothetical protein
LNGEDGMSWKSVCPGALMAVLLGFGTASAQYPTAPLYDTGPASTTVANDEDTPAPQKAPSQPHLSAWMANEREGCCGPLGLCGPMFTEFYARSGVSLPVNGKLFGRTLETGFEVEAGAQEHFLNHDLDRAWTVGLGITNIYNHGQHSEIKAHLRRILVPNSAGVATRIRGLDVSIQAYNRTFADLTFGREWYLYGCPVATGGCCNGERNVSWRVGVEGMFEYGSAKVELKELKHRSDVVAGLGVALYSDLEVPCGKSCTWIFGFRTVWDYTWSDILQHQNDTDLSDVNFLFTVGMKY